MNRLQDLEKAFKEKSGRPPGHIVRAPGRVNLIGEHTDYNEGWVLPMAIDRDVLIAASARSDNHVHLVALDRGSAESKFRLDDIQRDERHAWSNYVRGVARLLVQRGFGFPGFDAVITGNVPIGSGLSSSAALLVAAAVTCQTLGEFTLDRVSLAKLCRQAENEFCRVQSGIMDQFISALAEEDSALLIDCRALTYAHVRLPHACAIVVCDTMKRRALSHSAYNARRAECAQAARLLGSRLGKAFGALRDVGLDEFTSVERELPAVVAKRARHVIEENARVHSAVNAARADDAEAFGRLMNESHASLRDLYEVSSRELDLMVALAQEQEGVYGARLTGAGFGGCTVNLVQASVANPVAHVIASAYHARTGIAPQTFVVNASAGAGLVY